MAIINRSLDVSEQQYTVGKSVNGTATGAEYVLAIIPDSVQIMQAKSYALGLSGAPTAQLQLARFIEGAGATVINVGSALTQVAYGTSGLQSFDLGATPVYAQAGDVLQVASGGTNAALTDMAVEVVLKSLQDYKSWF
jgi:hypothetical protein